MPFHLSDTEWVMIVIAAIYLFECAFWVRREATCLSTLLGRFRSLASPPFMGNEQYKLVMGNPSPLARSYVCQPWPIAVSPEGICLPEAVQALSGGNPLRHVAFEAVVGEIVAVEKEVHFQDGIVISCASEEQAKQLAAMFKELAIAGEADRGRIIGEHLDCWTDNAAAAERIAELKTLIAPLRASGFMLFFLAFILGPALYYSPWPLGWSAILFYFTISFSTWMLVVWDYGACRKKLLGERFSERFRHVGMLLLSPASAMRSSEVLLRNGLARFHPLAAAAALCRKNRFAELARPTILALEHPRPDEVPSDPAACRIDAWFRKKLLKRLNSLLRRVEIDPAELLQPAEPLCDSRSYCPRCQNQFVLAEGTCPDCGGLALVAYGGESPADEKATRAPETNPEKAKTGSATRVK
jgi:hypothetical protein